MATWDTGFDINRQLAYAPVFVALLAFALTAGLGFIAVQQLTAGREAAAQGQMALAEDRRARDEALNAQTRQVLLALLLELESNWLAAVFYEGRLTIDQSEPYEPRLVFRENVFNGVIAGPLWTVPGVELVWTALANAYSASSRLTTILNRWRWVPFPLAAMLVAAFSRRGQREIVTVGGLFGVAAVVGTESNVMVSGIATSARLSIQRAIDALHAQLHIPARDWDRYDSEIGPPYRVLPPRRPTPMESALAWIGRWCAGVLRV